MSQQATPPAKNITLIGMPGAGKSTLGVVLAKKLGYSFVDTDLLLQESTGKLLSQILVEVGVEGFIQQENALLAGLVCEHHVIATGGSAVYSEDGMENLKKLGTVLFIEVELDELCGRLSPDLLSRGVVMRGNNTTVAQLYDERVPLYRRYADITVNTTGLSTLGSVEKLYAALAGVVERPEEGADA